MELNDYQRRATETAIYPKEWPEEASPELVGILYTALGLGEVGEIQGKVKKILRDANGVVTDEVRKAIAKEVGDALWYLANFSKEVGYSLDEIATGNLFKLQSRAERGTLNGDGDNR